MLAIVDAFGSIWDRTEGPEAVYKGGNKPLYAGQQQSCH
jgi:hypothetical protein